MFSSARQAEIIRSNQKDDYYAGYIKTSLADIVQLFSGPRTWMRWRKELDLVADLGYFALTTLAGLQSLGEEYVNVLQVDHTHKAIPSIWRRTAMVGIQVATPYLIDRFLSFVEKELQQNPHMQLSAAARANALQVIPVLRHIVMLLHRCHLAAFYMQGVFYHIAKRFTGIHYVLVRDGATGDRGSHYRLLGWMSLLQLSITFIQQLYTWGRHRSAPTPTSGRTQTLSTTKPAVQSSEEVPAARKCSLCLEARRQSTAPPCGHMFCWDCITEWAATKTECPLCREAFEINRLICLQNYDPI